jgi:hypothetical protein
MSGSKHEQSPRPGKRARHQAADATITVESSPQESPSDASDDDEPVDMPALESPMTLEEAEGLLPGLPLRALTPGWSSDDERRLRASWTDRDQVILERHTEEATDEPLLWRLMLQLFRRHPWHLFRYGLKYATTTPYMPPQLCDELATLVCHPIWGGDIAKLRYVLQVAVKCRVRDDR